ncbi:class I SAM-dependent methyltransferase [Grimontia sp. S25]|uniref:Class I SAM-dependent methyltransferase n=1 Tax=Grimontia sedimenti TaxID=2711294 RepID=A0A6M1RKT7_9GAMM|nr:class I SAM-dependent methyltransferase [Grimontia sedimenti]NGN98428.1 class I SAM-dependent methyltransferase [Grimontia sedimenti]
MNQQAKWNQYYQKVSPIPHRKLVERAQKLDKTGHRVAVDCGCGSGAETAYLLAQQYEVYAFDFNEDAVTLTHQRCKSHPKLNLTLDSFSEFEFPVSNLITANNSLFFCEAKELDAVWSRIRSSLIRGGVFCGDFIGHNDTWNQDTGRALAPVDKVMLDDMFKGFEIVFSKERDELGKTAIGNEKHWHTFTLIAIKR